MTVDEQLEFIESRIKADIEAMTPRDRTNYYQNLKEYQRPKLSRAGFIQADTAPEKIEIEIISKNED